MKTFDWKACFKDHPVFWDLEDEELDVILDDSLSREIVCQPQQVIVREGEAGDSVFLIGQGEVKVMLTDGRGPGTHIAILGPGEFFGEMAVLEGRPRMATVVAEGSCTLLEINGAKFREFLVKHPAIEFKIAAKLSQRLRDVTEHVLTVRVKDVDQKLELFNNKLESELRVMDASLRANQAVFDQTNKRANEIIESAERSRSRLSASVGVIAGVIGILVTALGFVGFKTVNQFEDALTTYVEIEKKIKQIDRLSRDLESKEQKITDLNREISDANRELKENVKKFHLDVSIPRLKENLKGSNPSNIEQYADLMRQDDAEITANLFKVVLGGLSDPSDYSGGRERFIDLLKKSINRGLLTKEQEVFSYYLMLSTMVINGMDMDYDYFLRAYEAAASEYRGTQKSVRDSLGKKLEVEGHFLRILKEEPGASSVSGGSAKRWSDAELQSRVDKLQALWDKVP